MPFFIVVYVIMYLYQTSFTQCLVFIFILHAVHLVALILAKIVSGSQIMH